MTTFVVDGYGYHTLQFGFLVWVCLATCLSIFNVENYSFSCAPMAKWLWQRAYDPVIMGSNPGAASCGFTHIC